MLYSITLIPLKTSQGDPMKIKKTYKSILAVLLVLTTISMVTAVGLSVREEKKQETIDELKETVTRLTKEMEEVSLHKEKADFHNFRESAFNVKYPDFSEIVDIVYEKSKTYGFSPYIIMALIQVESNFDPYAVSTAGAYGLMQVNYSVWKDTFGIDFNRICEKEYNIDLGLKILDYYYKMSSGDLVSALQRYNGTFNSSSSHFGKRVITSKFYAQYNNKEENEQNNR
jgi:hypothetical protein